MSFIDVEKVVSLVSFGECGEMVVAKEESTLLVIFEAASVDEVAICIKLLVQFSKSRPISRFLSHCERS